MRVYQLTALGAAEFEREHFAEAVVLLAQSAQLRPNYYANFLMLSACYGHLGKTEAARDALARLRNLVTAPIETVGDRFFRRPAHLKLLIDGIALADRRSPADGLATPDS
jgi:hypothetical protein